MIVEILSQKYKCNCNRGIYKLEKPGLLVKLNCILEWDFCKFPEDSDGTEDRTFLNNEDGDPELKPGNCFLYDGQVIAVNDENSLVLVVSETGVGALERIYEENLKPEFEMEFNDYDTEVTWEVCEEEIPDNFESYPVPYNIYKIWKDKFISGRGFLEKGLCIKTNVVSDSLIFPVTIYMTDWNIKYDPNEIETDQISSIALELITWFYGNYKRIKPLETEKQDETVNGDETVIQHTA